MRQTPTRPERGGGANGSTLLQITDLHLQFDTPQGVIRALEGVNLHIDKGETVGLVGESGCGKSVTARAILNMVQKPGRITGGSIRLAPRDPQSGQPIDILRLRAGGAAIRSIRGGDIAMVFQEPMTAFSPVHSVGSQIVEAIRLHRQVSRGAAQARAVELLDLAGVPDAAGRVDAYPFELSGGLRQRAMIAMALASEPRLLIADEPTTALDVTIQAQILKLLQRLQQRLGMAVLMITHNIGVVAAMAHRVAIMYLGRIVEQGPVQDIFADPHHPYTRGLLRSVPQIGAEVRRGQLAGISGSLPNPHVRVPGCPFHPRCPEFIDQRCAQAMPAAVAVGQQHQVRCFLYGDEQESGGDGGDGRADQPGRGAHQGRVHAQDSHVG